MIAVIGSRDAPPDALADAEAVGRELARRGAMVVCGGMGGIMEAVCRGAKSAGGMTIGILPGDNPAEANAYVDIPISTGIGYARNAIVVRTGQAVIAINGAYGTLSEIGHALGEGVPVIGLRTWRLERARAGGVEDTGIIKATTPAQAVELALKAADARIAAWLSGNRLHP
jgi:uncharacterized protein (TIGR00725 family)